MRFLCIRCNEAMLCKREEERDNSSIDLIFTCDNCGNRVKMITNTEETKLINNINPELGKTESRTTTLNKGDEMKLDDESGEPLWTEEAKSRLERIPPFVRPMVMKGIEEFAKEKGIKTIDPHVMDEVRSEFGM